MRAEETFGQLVGRVGPLRSAPGCFATTLAERGEKPGQKGMVEEMR